MKLIDQIHEDALLRRFPSRFVKETIYSPDDLSPASLGESFLEKDGVYISGNPGTGKTQLLIDYASALIWDERVEGSHDPYFYASKVGFYNVPTLVRNIADPNFYKEVEPGYFGSLNSLFELFKKNDLYSLDYIILDDFGSEQPTEANLEIVRQIINRIYEIGRPSIFITSNLSSEEVGKVYGLRTLSRLVEMCDFFEMPNKTDRRIKK